MRPVTVLARNIRLLVIENGVDQLWMKRMLDSCIFVTRQAIDGFDFFFMRNVVWIESGVAGDANEFLVRGGIKRRFADVQG